MRHLGWAVLLAGGLCSACSVVDRVSLSICADVSAPKRSIPACSRLLKQGKLDSKQRGNVLFNRAQAYLAVGGRAEEASADLDDLVKLQPDNAMAYGARGVALMQLGERDLAMTDFDRAIELDPTDFRALANRATLRQELGQSTRALEDYDRSLLLVPGAEVPLGGRCWVRAVIGRDLEGAVADCTRAIATSADPNLRNSRGFAYYRMQRYADAIGENDAAIQADPLVAASHYIRGMAKLALGEETAAKADIERGLAMEPGVADRYAGYGVGVH